MALAHYYRILGLRTGASFDDVKLAYRNLARLYHPDVNPSDQLAKEKFIQVTQAYRALADALPRMISPAQRSWPTPPAPPAPPSRPQPAPDTAPQPSAAPRVEFTGSPTPVGSEAEQQLKASSYHQLRDFLGSQRFPRAVALVEGLAQRFPEDPEVRQWHALTYYRWGHDLLTQGNLIKAEACLKKAGRVDPLNKSLRQALQHDFQRLTHLRHIAMPQAQ